MLFDEKLKMAMLDLKINQAQLVGLTGIGKSSISQYMSGKNTPTEERRKHIAVSLGLDPDYFEKENDITVILPKKILEKSGIEHLDVRIAAKLLGMNHNTVRKGLQQGVFPWGYAIHTSENRWVYFINAKRFAEIEGIEVPQEMVV